MEKQSEQMEWKSTCEQCVGSDKLHLVELCKLSDITKCEHGCGATHFENKETRNTCCLLGDEPTRH